MKYSPPWNCGVDICASMYLRVKPVILGVHIYTKKGSVPVASVYTCQKMKYILIVHLATWYLLNIMPTNVQAQTHWQPVYTVFSPKCLGFRRFTGFTIDLYRSPYYAQPYSAHCHLFPMFLWTYRYTYYMCVYTCVCMCVRVCICGSLT